MVKERIVISVLSHRTHSPSGFLARPYTVYQLEVKINRHQWMMYKRYSQILALHESLIAEVPPVQGISFPPKHGVLGTASVSKDVIEERTMMFKAYFKEALSMTAVQKSPHLRAFIAYDEHMSVPMPSEREELMHGAVPAAGRRTSRSHGSRHGSRHGSNSSHGNGGKAKTRRRSSGSPGRAAAAPGMLSSKEAGDAMARATDMAREAVAVAHQTNELGAATLGDLHQQGQAIDRANATTEQMNAQLSGTTEVLHGMESVFVAAKQRVTGETARIHAAMNRDNTAIDAGAAADNGSVGAPAPPVSDAQAGAEDSSKPEDAGDGAVGRGVDAPAAASGAAHQDLVDRESMLQVHSERMAQDAALSDLSAALGDMKAMAMEMGGELDQHNAALDTLTENVDQAEFKLKHANDRMDHMMGKERDGDA